MSEYTADNVEPESELRAEFIRNIVRGIKCGPCMWSVADRQGFCQIQMFVRMPGRQYESGFFTIGPEATEKDVLDVALIMVDQFAKSNVRRYFTYHGQRLFTEEDV